MPPAPLLGSTPHSPLYVAPIAPKYEPYFIRFVLEDGEIAVSKDDHPPMPPEIYASILESGDDDKKVCRIVQFLRNHTSMRSLPKMKSTSNDGLQMLRQFNSMRDLFVIPRGDYASVLEDEEYDEAISRTRASSTFRKWWGLR